MSKTHKLIAAVTPGIITGSVIAGYNIFNIKNSPNYNGNMTNVDYTRFGIMIGIKSIIYGTFYPFSWISILIDTVKYKRFHTHFIPFSRYGIQNQKHD